MPKAGEIAVGVFQHVREVFKGMVVAAVFAARGTQRVLLNGWFAEHLRRRSCGDASKVKGRFAHEFRAGEKKIRMNEYKNTQTHLHPLIDAEEISGNSVKSIQLRECKYCGRSVSICSAARRRGYGVGTLHEHCNLLSLNVIPVSLSQFVAPFRCKVVFDTEFPAQRAPSQQHRCLASHTCNVP